MNWQRDFGQAEGPSSEEELLRKRFPLPEPNTLIFYYLQQQLVKLGKRFQIRQLALATAQVYILRFYTTVNIRTTNPFLILTTAFYLACKTEECPQHIRMVANESRNFWPEFVSGVDAAVLGECEFVLIQELNAQLVVTHPYTDLHQIKDELDLTPDETAQAWYVINDAHATTLPLVHTPRTIAAAAASIVMLVRGGLGGSMFALGSSMSQGGSMATGSTSGATASRAQRVVRWLAESGLCLEATVECTQTLISLYTTLERYDEHTCKQQLGALARARGLTGA